MPKDDIFNEIDEIKQLLDNDTEGENLSLSVEDILAEYQYEKTVAPAAARKEKPDKPPRGEDLPDIKTDGKPEKRTSDFAGRNGGTRGADAGTRSEETGCAGARPETASDRG